MLLFPFILLAAAVRLVFPIIFACISVRLGLAFRCSFISAPVIQHGTCVGLEHTRLALRFRCFRDSALAAVDGIHDIGAFILETLLRGLGRRPLTAVNADLWVAWGMPREFFFAFFSWPRSVGAKSRYISAPRDAVRVIMIVFLSRKARITAYPTVPRISSSSPRVLAAVLLTLRDYGRTNAAFFSFAKTEISKSPVSKVPPELAKHESAQHKVSKEMKRKRDAEDVG